MRSFVPQAVPGQERMNARTEGFEVSLQLHRREQDINAHVSPTPFSTADVQVIDRLQMVAFSILAIQLAEWDTTVSKKFAQKAIQYILTCNAKLCKETTLIYE